jgi:plastocyanin
VVVVVNTTPNATPTPKPTPQPSVTITFNADMTISPGTTVYIPVGGKVVWVNADPFKPHAVQAVNVQTAKYFGGMDTVLIVYNETPKPFEVTFDKAGSYDYKTVFQPEMNGKIIVTA